MEKGKKMSDRLISANELMNYINGSIKAMTKIGVAVDGEYLWGLINYAIEDAPTVDAVEVVRCKDCRFRYQDGANFCLLGSMCMSDEWFCADGERREDETD